MSHLTYRITSPTARGQSKHAPHAKIGHTLSPPLSPRVVPLALTSPPHDGSHKPSSSEALPCLMIRPELEERLGGGKVSMVAPALERRLGSSGWCTVSFLACLYTSGWEGEEGGGEATGEGTARQSEHERGREGERDSGREGRGCDDGAVG